LKQAAQGTSGAAVPGDIQETDVALRDMVRGHGGDELMTGLDNSSVFFPTLMILQLVCTLHTQSKSTPQCHLPRLDPHPSHCAMCSVGTPTMRSPTQPAMLTSAELPHTHNSLLLTSKLITSTLTKRLDFTIV